MSDRLRLGQKPGLKRKKKNLRIAGSPGVTPVKNMGVTPQASMKPIGKDFGVDPNQKSKGLQLLDLTTKGTGTIQQGKAPTTTRAATPTPPTQKSPMLQEQSQPQQGVDQTFMQKLKSGLGIDTEKGTVFGMDKDKFSGLTGNLAYAIAPDTPQGRAGRVLGQFGMEEYGRKQREGREDELLLGKRARLDEEAKTQRKLFEEDRAEKRKYQEGLLSERRDYQEGLSKTEFERGAGARDLNKRYREAQITALGKDKKFKPSDAETAKRNYMQETGATHTEASEWYATLGKGEPTDTGESSFKNISAQLSSVGMLDETDNSYHVPTEKGAGLPANIVAGLEESGHSYYVSDSDGGKKVTIGSYDPKKAQRYREMKTQAVRAGFQQFVNNKGKSEWRNPGTGEKLNFKTGAISQAKKIKPPTGGSTVGNLLKSKAKTPKVRGTQRFNKFGQKVVEGIGLGGKRVGKEIKKAFRIGD